MPGSGRPSAAAKSPSVDNAGSLGFRASIPLKCGRGRGGELHTIGCFSFVAIFALPRCLYCSFSLFDWNRRLEELSSKAQDFENLLRELGNVVDGRAKERIRNTLEKV